MKAMDKRLTTLEQRIGSPADQSRPTEIWLIAAGEPDNTVLLWKRCGQDNEQGKQDAS